MNTVDCGCNEGFYEDGTNLNCKECEYPCTKCSDTSTCVGECSSTLNRNSAPTCSWLDGFFDNGSICVGNQI